MRSRVACSASFWPVGFCLKAAEDVRYFSILREAQKELKIKNFGR
jgi:hypothetical protein